MNDQIEKQQLQSLINLYETTLNYYANINNYSGDEPEILYDGGTKADFALKEKDNILNYNIMDNLKDLISVMEAGEEYTQEELMNLIKKVKNVKL